MELIGHGWSESSNRYHVEMRAPLDTRHGFSCRGSGEPDPSFPFKVVVLYDRHTDRQPSIYHGMVYTQTPQRESKSDPPAF